MPGALFAKYLESQRMYLAQESDLGRIVTGNGTTIFGAKLVNFLCHDKMKDTMLLRVLNCEPRLTDGAKADALYIANEPLKALKSTGHIFSVNFL